MLCVVAIVSIVKDAIKAKSVLDQIMSRPENEKIKLTIERDAKIMEVCEEGLNDNQDDRQGE